MEIHILHAIEIKLSIIIIPWSWRNYHLFIGNICQLDKHFLTCFFIDDDGFNPKGSMVEDSGSMGLDKVARIYGWTLQIDDMKQLWQAGIQVGNGNEIEALCGAKKDIIEAIK